ncbi:MAG: aminotransferase class I/II-fold pyridoxal phosphate-dependent enzyme [Planctomycetota bacterium]
MHDFDTLITDRLHGIDASGIRRVFDLAASLEDPINLSIGQPDFDVPPEVKQAAADAIAQGVNRYTQTQGLAALREKLTVQLTGEFPDTLGPSLRNGDSSLLITSGVSGGLLLAMLTLIQPGDEVLIADPYFVMYRHLVTLAGGTAKYIDTYPDFQLTVERVAPQVTDRTKLLLFNSPSNPTGVIPPKQVAADLAAFCAERGVLMLSDEIYDVFTYADVPADRRGRLSDQANPSEPAAFPSPLHACPDVLLLRGFSKTYGMTGWRLGYAVGPTPVVEQMTKLQQYTFVCAPSMVQVAGALALDVDMSDHVAAYARKRDRVVERLSPHYELTRPGGAFYAFPRVPERLGLTGTQFVERAIERNVLAIPGNVFSQRDTHFRLSYACDDDTLDRGLDVLVELAEAPG